MNDQEHKCQCDFRIRMLGDGCRYCQPQEYIDRLHDTMDGMIHTDCFELTDEEVNDAWKQSHEDGIAMQQGFTTQQHYFAHLILRKAQNK